MGKTISVQYYDATPSFQLLSDVLCHKIILSTIDIAKTAQQIALENGLAVSTTCKNY